MAYPKKDIEQPELEERIMTKMRVVKTCERARLFRATHGLFGEKTFNRTLKKLWYKGQILIKWDYKTERPDDIIIL